MSSLRDEGPDGVAADPTASNGHAGAAADSTDSNDHAEASASAPVDSVSAPAPLTIPPEERPLPPTPPAELESELDILDPVPVEDPTELAPATPAKPLSLPSRPASGLGASGSSAGERVSSAPVATSTPTPTPAPAPAPAFVSVPEAEPEREPTPPPAPVPFGASALPEPTATAPEPIRRVSAARSQYQAPLPPTPQQASSQPQQPQQPRRLSQQEYIVPRWQPDSEVLYCPICFVYFSLFTRKHHCRKCGRVVCNSCSPHRITIPHAFIVQPPEVLQAREQALAAGGATARAAAASALPALGAGGVPVGGERVRLCNPCVPDPNTSPPSSGASASQYGNNTHIRSRSGSNIAGGIPGGNYYSFAGPDASSSRTRRQGLDFLSPSGSSFGGGSGDRRYTVSNAQNSSGAAGPSSSSSSRSQYYGSLPPQNSRYHHRMNLPPQPGDGTMASASASSQHQHQHHHQRQPRYQIPEEDECPVCHFELPKRTLPNFEALREQHIEECISLHSQYMMGNTSGAAAGRTRAASTAISATPSSSGPQPMPSPLRSRPRRTNSNNDNDNISGSDGSPSDFGGEVSSSVDSMGSSGSAAYSPSSPRAMAMAVHRHTAMFPYKATEKDCASDAECTICLEDLEVGVAMARLECFCRFHEQCIRAWFVRHPGRCPVHQHGMAD